MTPSTSTASPSHLSPGRVRRSRPRELAASVGLPLAAAALGSVATATGTRSAWYRSLDKPAIQPPAVVFPIAWSALYTQSALGSALAQRHMEEATARDHRRRLAVNMALNAGWCWSFFAARRIGPSIGVAGALAVSSADLALRAGRARTASGLLLAPYAGWCGFATVLTAAIWRSNRGR